MNTCGICNSRGCISVYFSLKDNIVWYIVECPVCGYKTAFNKTKATAVREWEQLNPALF